MIPSDYNARYSPEQHVAAIVESIALNDDFRKAITPVQDYPQLKKLEELKAVIGEELYNALSDEDRLFMADTAGAIDFGHPIDLHMVARDIEEYGDTE